MTENAMQQWIDELLPDANNTALSMLPQLNVTQYLQTLDANCPPGMFDEHSQMFMDYDDAEETAGTSQAH